uniref:C2H2-type domain-containing protein n=1 Tax=Caenorhabditis japonica TaxID=281687 RepID=A0A8R1DJ58_CAEJA
MRKRAGKREKNERPIYGYQDELEDFVKVYFSSPWYLQKATHALGKESHHKAIFQPYEAHIPFHLQFFIDNSIFGMDNIHLSRVKFRVDSTNPDGEICYKDVTFGEVKFDECLNLLSPYERKTNCQLECDALVTDILNVEMHTKNVHSSNPGLEYIWREEKERCDALGILLEDVFNSYEPRKAKLWPQERDMLRTARRVARQLRHERNMSENLDGGFKNVRRRPKGVHESGGLSKRSVGLNEAKRIASTGNRTRAARVAGEHSTTEPPMLVFLIPRN